MDHRVVSVHVLCHWIHECPTALTGSISAPPPPTRTAPRRTRFLRRPSRTSVVMLRSCSQGIQDTPFKSPQLRAKAVLGTELNLPSIKPTKDHGGLGKRESETEGENICKLSSGKQPSTCLGIGKNPVCASSTTIAEYLAAGTAVARWGAGQGVGQDEKVWSCPLRITISNEIKSCPLPDLI